jgi:hypothetical protein
MRHAVADALVNQQLCALRERQAYGFFDHACTPITRPFPHSFLSAHQLFFPRSMAVSAIPGVGFSLRGAPEDIMHADKHHSKSAILFKLSRSMLNDLLEASNGKDGVHFVTGKVPVRLS